MRLILILLILTESIFLGAQKITISGYVRDVESGENLIGATILDVSKQKGATANVYGFYSLTLPKDSAVLTYSYVGYQPHIIQLDLRRDTVIIVKMKSAIMLQEVVVRGDRPDRIQETSRMSTVTVPINQIKLLPAFMGESDVMKIIQLLPGVQGGNEGSSGLYVRGGGPDQNLILLDGVPVYNASHLYGFFSTFNPDAINHVELVKGGFPARYGGRLSSVVDITMKEGSQGKLHGQGSIGLIAAKFTLEGPMIKDRTSFIISGRRSYLNLLKASVVPRQPDGVSDAYYFYDLNAKVNHRINARNRVYISAYMGEDQARTVTEYTMTDSLQTTYSSKNQSDLQWGNLITAVRWNHVFSKKLFSNLSLSYSEYLLKTVNKTSNGKTYPSGESDEQYFNYHYQSGIRDIASKLDFDFIPNPSHYIRFGANFIRHFFTPGVLAQSSSQELAIQPIPTQDLSANESSIYAEDDWTVSQRLKLNIGIHGSSFMVNDRSYYSIQPRLAARYMLPQEMSLKASFATMQQYVHLLSNAGFGIPTDLWVPSTTSIRPETSVQGAIGFAKSFKDEFELSLEGYYKTMNNVLEYKDGASYLNVRERWENKVEGGQGRSYGAELFVQRKTGKLNGWLGYTLSWTDRQFDNLNDGKWFPYRYDRRHDVKVTAIYQFNKRLDLGLTWIYGTGNAVTVPLDWYRTISEYNVMPWDFAVVHYEGRNNYRMRDYHRLDLNIGYTLTGKAVEHKLAFSVYNVYARRNPFYLLFVSTDKGLAIRQKSLFPAMPSVSYSIKF